MADPAEFLRSVTDGAATETALYLEDLNNALEIGGRVVDGILTMHWVQSEPHGENGHLPVPELVDVAHRVAALVRTGLGVLENLKEGGVLNIPEGAQLELPAITTIATPAAWEITTGTDSEDDVTEIDAPDDAVADTSDEPVELEVSEWSRASQEKLLKELLGEEHEDAIAQLTQAQMVQLGRLFQNVYMHAKIGARGEETRRERANQFLDVLGGLDSEDLRLKYDMNPNVIKNSLRTAATQVLPRALGEGEDPDERIESGRAKIRALFANALEQLKLL